VAESESPVLHEALRAVLSLVRLRGMPARVPLSVQLPHRDDHVRAEHLKYYASYRLLKEAQAHRTRAIQQSQPLSAGAL
jgi:hypothetical protein